MITRKGLRAAGIGITAMLTSLFAQGCLDRPVVGIVPGGTTISTNKLRATRVDKVDLLLVIDNSASMADKQSELAARIPELIKPLVDTTPDASGKINAVLDMHVGVITSSLGSHGTSACDPSYIGTPNVNDRGRLLPRPTDTSLGAGCEAPVGATAVSWVFDPGRDPSARFKGADGAVKLAAASTCVVQSARENGCGYEETMEAAYHFLADPAPYADAKVPGCTFSPTGDSCASAANITVSGLDEELLAQRKAFLRPDSLLAVIILSDENDFSLKPAGKNWLPWGFGAGAMARGWAECANVPDDFEPESAGDFDLLHTKYKCKSCFEDGSDPNCKVPWSTDKLNNDVDGRNLRGFGQTQRFGYNFLWGRQRFVDGFKKPSVPDSTGKFAANPIYSGGFRTPELVVVAAIVGVPNQLIPTNPDGTPKSPSEADWEKIIGPVGKRDPHMVESIKPRTDLGIPKFAGDRKVDPMNGGDRDVPDGDDLQYACIQERSDKAAATKSFADCDSADTAKLNPLCAGARNQPFYKAYPGTRILRMIKDLGPQGFAASICAPSFTPAVRGIVDKLKSALNGQCLSTILEQDTTGNVSCNIAEVFVADSVAGKGRCEDIGKAYCTPGAEPCRLVGSDLPPLAPAAAAAQLTLGIAVKKSDGTVQTEAVTATADGSSVFAVGSDGVKRLICEVKQLAGGRVPAGETTSCTKDPKFEAADGWCYSSDDAVIGPQCKKLGSAGTVRFLGTAQPKNGSEVFTICISSLGGNPGK